MGGGVEVKGKKEEEEKRMYPQRSCGVSNMALVLCKKKRETEQINSDHQIPPISSSSPCPRGLKLTGGCRRSYANTYGLCTHGQSTVIRRRLEQILVDILNFLIIVMVM